MAEEKQKMAEEKRLIDANALMEKVQFRLPITNDVNRIINKCVLTTRKAIVDAPTVDAVEVVRCKDCKGWCSEEIAKHYGVDRYCTMTRTLTDADDFCSYGERREGE